MSGKIITSGLAVFLLIFGGALYYSQYYAHYQVVTGLTHITVGGQNMGVADYDGIDAESSGLKLRGCFTADPADFAQMPIAALPTPLTPPKWFTCFDPVQLETDLASGAAVAYLAAVDEKDGIDRIVAVYPDGRGFQWRQLNEKYQD